jgi:hypothetical protein
MRKSAEASVQRNGSRQSRYRVLPLFQPAAELATRITAAGPEETDIRASPSQMASDRRTRCTANQIEARTGQ